MKKEITKKQVTDVKLGEEIRCDGCNKFLFSVKRIHPTKVANFFTVTTGHHDYGYESAESIEVKDLCKDCMEKEVEAYKKLVEESPRSTNYIEIEQQWYYEETEE